MLPSVPTDAALASLRTRFQAMSQQVTGGLCSISARVHELPEAQRPPLLGVLHNLEGMQLKLRQLVEQGSLGGAASIAASINVLEAAIPAQLDLLGQVSALADRIGLRVHAAAAQYSHASDNRGPWPPAFLLPPPTAVAHLPQALPHPGPPVHAYVALAPHPGVYHQPPPPGYPVAVAPAWPQAPPPARAAEPDDADYDDRDEAEEEPGRRRSSPRRRARDEEAGRRPPWSPLRDISSVGLMLGAVIAGGFSFADRIYRPSGPGDKLAMFEQAGREPGVLGPAAQSVVGDKFQGRLSEEPGASERADAPRAAAAADGLAPAQALAPEIEHTLEPPAPPAPAQALAPPAPRGRSAIPTAPQRPAMPTAGQRPPVKLIAKVPEPAAPPASPAPSPKIEQAALVAPPPAAAKPAAQPPAPAPADPDAAESSGGLFVPVLSTHKDAKAAREAFAELQKKHAAVLGAKQSEVQASASEGGAWHRLVVTPATSKEAATEVCSKLRTAGYGRCWVKPY